MTSKKIKTEAELRLYLKGKWFDCLIITEPIMPSEPIYINRPVEIVGSGLGKQVINDYIGSEAEPALFIVNSGGVKFNDLHFYRTYSPVPLLPTDFQAAIKFQNGVGKCEIDDCKFHGFNWAAIWNFDCDWLNVNDCYIKGDGTLGHNWGIWNGGKGDSFNQTLMLTNSTICNVKHVIGAHYGPNNYYAINNTIGTEKYPGSLKHSFDRHNWNSGGRKGGLHTHICGNTFLDPDRLAFSIEPPYEGGSFSFIGNTLNHSKERWIGEVSDERVWEGRSPDWYTAHSNKFKTT